MASSCLESITPKHDHTFVPCVKAAACVRTNPRKRVARRTSACAPPQSCPHSESQVKRAFKRRSCSPAYFSWRSRREWFA